LRNLISIVSVIILAFFILSIVFAQAEDNGVEVLALGPKVKEIKSREVVTFPFRVSNTTNQTREFIGELILPKQWLPITKDFPFKLDKGESEIRLVSFFVPKTVLAGIYEITYLVRDRDFPSISGRCSTVVIALPFVKLKVELLESPEYVVAGEDYQPRFIVINEGNVTITIVLEIESENDYPATADMVKFQLLPGESKTAIVTVKTDAKINRELRYRLELKARILELEYSTIKASAYSWVKIIPRISSSEDQFHTIPVKIKLREEVWRRKAKVNKAFNQRYPAMAHWTKRALNTSIFSSEGRTFRKSLSLVSETNIA